ncbi:MAG: M48 family metalloprotease [Paracoccus sp. (in: a-proteobacteria)]|uniref:M48 family metalloprotease n=1 Tax=Paracoccus sp. TaxID=267 RepID=UPI0026E023D1|nr:M48 family metalloprotease [Paracoccus sp. (in: a-proteobacteria)]MDO5621817.1 M48 family metalloprotease [Paracoccus sp. (in: a-proteobacteria)]
MKARLAAVVMAFALSGCVIVPVDEAGRPIATTPAPTPATVPMPQPSPNVQATPRAQAQSFAQLVRHMEPIIERQCLQRRTQAINCDYQFVVDDRPGQGVNAFQSLDSSGRPVIGFTLALIAEARNADEMALVVGHEAAHHILNHLDQKSSAASMGAIILGGLATAGGADERTVRGVQNMGAEFATRYYSKDWELQADYLGAILVLNSGFDPVNGSRFFDRIPDPGEHMLGTHPSRAQRQMQIRRAVEDYRSGRIS